jgi:type IV fimbrial biogenesis protein FimT
MCRSLQLGFTMIEMMLALALAAVLMTVAVPTFREVGLSGQLRSISSELIASTRFARSEAIKQNAVIKLCVSSNGVTCGAGGWQQGWIVVRDTTVLQRHAASPTNIRMIEANSVAALDFQPTGLGVTAASITVCRAAPLLGKQERIVTVDASGRARVKRTTTSQCP